MADILNMKKGYSELADLIDGVLAISPLASGEGDVYFLNPSHSQASDTGNMNLKKNNKNKPFSTYAAAYAQLTANQNDILIYVGGSSSITLSVAATWAKSYTHFIGVCAPTRVGQRARLFQLSTLTGADPLFTVSANGCVFSNFYIFQGVADATSLTNVSVTGERNYFENVHFAGGGHATQAINGGSSLFINGGAENTFVDCTIGVDTIPAATGMVGILFDDQASRNIFENCQVTMYAGHTGAAFVEVVDGTGIDRYTEFNGCRFINSNSDNFLMASAFVIPAFAANNSSRILLDTTCMIHGTSKQDADDRGVLFGNLNAFTGADASGLAVELKT